jgi:DNA-binding NarL/FixJ family response regulator
MTGTASTSPNREVPRQAVTVALHLEAPELARKVTRVLAENGTYLVCPLRSSEDSPGTQGSSLNGYDGDEPELVVLARRGATAGRWDALRRLRDRVSTARLIVILQRTRGTVELRKALALGADAVVFDDELESTLHASLEAVRCGQLVLPRALHAHFARRPLSARERQVIGLVLHGLTNREIADRLFLAESTIKSHLTSVFEKLNVRSRSEAAALILDPSEGLAPGVLAIANGHAASSRD